MENANGVVGIGWTGGRDSEANGVMTKLTLKSDDTLLFYGDSITDCGRDRGDPAKLGGGYVAQIGARVQVAMAAPELKVFNLGVSGNRVFDLETRLEGEVLPLRPSVVTFLIGINDTWRRYDRGLVSEIAAFQESYRRILTRLKEAGVERLVLMEPFLLPVPEDRRRWREDLDPRITAVRELAVEFGAGLIALDGVFAVAATRAPAGYWAPDGVHPSAAGHALIAEAWLRHAGVG